MKISEAISDRLTRAYLLIALSLGLYVIDEGI
jgi:hypothetical protein